MFHLKPYTVPCEYSRIYAENFSVINGISSEKKIIRLAQVLSKISGIDCEIVLLEMKRFIMNSHEYKWFSHPHEAAETHSLPVRTGFCTRFLEYIIKLFQNKKRSERQEGKQKADLLIDVWSEGVKDNLYGPFILKTLDARYKTVYIDFLGKFQRHLRHLFGLAFGYMVSMIKAGGIFKEYRIDLKGFIAQFFNQLLSGWHLRKQYSPKVILSGNDNGFPVILGIAAGAKVVLVQNAKKCLFSDASFKYSDLLIAISDMLSNSVLEKTGCSFQEILTLGSLRMFNFLQQSGKDAGRSIRYDILWISDLELTPDTDRTFGHYYKMDSEIEAIRLLNDYASKHDLRIAYKCRTEDELGKIKELGLRSENIFYIGRSEENTYRCVMESDVVLSTLSTVVVEALGIGKKGGYVNLSGNPNVNYDVKQFNIEYTKESSMSFSRFVDAIRNQNIDFSGCVSQDGHYGERFLEMIEKIINS